MSYTRRYSETVSKTVSKTISISYPASQNGGTLSRTVSILAEIPVDIDINVDTVPFDSSVQHCGTNVNLLTAAVVATESATIISKRRNSTKVADTIIGGFFSYVKSEISQQIAEITQQTDSLLMHITELSKACLAKKQQMEGDFHRISERYSKIFFDLNHELSNRIHQLDEPVFGFKRESDGQRLRAFSNDLTNTTTVFGKESSDLQAKVSVSIAKKRALDTLHQAKIFLWQQRNLSDTIQHCMLSDNVSNSYYAPVCVAAFNQEGNKVLKSTFVPDGLPNAKNQQFHDELIQDFMAEENKWSAIAPADEKQLSFYFHKELHNKCSSNDLRTIRVRETIQSIAHLSLINVINI